MQVPASPVKPTADELYEEEADCKWMDSLKSTATGKKLCCFLGHVVSVLDDGNLGLECPIDQAVSFRRVLIRALETSATPFNLPKKLPKFIAVVQLSGERMMLTTNRSQLFQLLAHAPSGARANSDAMAGMAKMIKYQRENPKSSLLLTYSAPFAVDLEELWWDVRSIRRDESTLKVIDGEMAFQVGQCAPRCMSATSNFETEMTLLTLGKEIDAFKAHVTAVDMDMELQNSENVDRSEQVSKRVATLEGVLSRMKADRTRLIENYEAEKKDLTDRLKSSQEYLAEASRMRSAEEKASETSMNEEINRLAKECEAGISAVREHKRENVRLTAAYAAEQSAMEIQMCEQAEQLKIRVKELETAAKTAAVDAARISKQNQAALRKRDSAHQRSFDEYERKFSQLQMVERGARQEVEELNQRLRVVHDRMNGLSTAMDGRDNEKELLEHQVRQFRNSTKVMKALLVLSCVRTTNEVDELNGKIKTMNLALGCNTVETKKLQELIRAREAERDALGMANAELQKQIDENNATSATSAASATSAPQMADVETMTVPITTDQDLKMGELETRNVKLQDDLDEVRNYCTTLKAELQRAKVKASKKAPPAGLMVDADSGNHGATTTTTIANTDLGHATDVDVNVEHLISNAAQHLRILAEQVRDSARHRAAAVEGWAQVRALQNYGGYQIQPLQPLQPVHHWQIHPNSYH